MLNLIYAPIFMRQYKKLEPALQEEILEKIEIFQDDNNQLSLKKHKLHGQLSGKYSFSVNYKIRIVFEYLSKKEVAILTVGDHEIYN